MHATQSEADIRAALEREEQLDLSDPLRHFLAVDASTSFPSDTSGSSTDIRDLPSTHDYSVVPEQRESIVNQHVTIRYYSDLARRPDLLGLDDKQEGRGEWWDVQLKLDMSTGCGGKIWPAAEVLGAYIAGKYSSPGTKQNVGSNAGYNNHNFDWRGKCIIELGSGTGLVGYLVHALSLPDCKIWVTDQDAMLPLMRENLHLNFPTSSTSSSGDAFVKVAELDWGTPISPEFGQPDVLLLADCVYLEIAFQPLVETMAALSTSETEILFCYQKRRKADKRFFGLLRKSFTWEDIVDDDETRMKEYRRQGTQLLRIKKKA